MQGESGQPSVPSRWFLHVLGDEAFARHGSRSAEREALAIGDGDSEEKESSINTIRVYGPYHDVISLVLENQKLAYGTLSLSNWVIQRDLCRVGIKGWIP